MRYRKSIFLTALFVSWLPAAFAGTDAEGDYKRPPQHVVDSVLGGANYYSGMTKDELYKVYPVSRQKNYYKEGNEEWIMFDDILAKDETKKIIVFYLKDGKVSGWTTKEMEKTPDERVKTITERRKQFGGADLSGGGPVKTEPPKRQIYQPTRVNISDW